jgi:hypothetical protein
MQHHALVGRVQPVAVPAPAARQAVHLDVAAPQQPVGVGQHRAHEVRARPAPATAREDHPQVLPTAVHQPVRGVLPLLPGLG